MSVREFYENGLYFISRFATESERPADRQRREMPRPRRRAPARRRIGVWNVAALHLGIDAAHDAFGYRMRRRQHGEIDLQHGAKHVVMAMQRGEEFRR